MQNLSSYQIKSTLKTPIFTSHYSEKKRWLTDEQQNQVIGMSNSNVTVSLVVRCFEMIRHTILKVINRFQMTGSTKIGQGSNLQHLFKNGTLVLYIWRIGFKVPSTLPKNYLDQEESVVILCAGDFFSHVIVASIDLSLCILNLPQKTVNKVNKYHIFRTICE